MSREFTAASSSRIDLNTIVGDWDYTQPFSVSVWVNPKTNLIGTILSKQEGVVNTRGWSVGTSLGVTGSTFSIQLCNTAVLKLIVRTTAEFTLNTWHHVAFTYSGNGLASGVAIWVDGVSQALTTLSNLLGGNTILNAVETQIGSKGGILAPVLPADYYLRRLTLHNVVLTSQEITDMYAGTTVTQRGIQLWQEFGASNSGSSVIVDWAGSVILGVAFNAPYSNNDPPVMPVRPRLMGRTKVMAKLML